MKTILILSPRNLDIYYNQNSLAPKNNEPILTEVAPNFIASSKSLLIPMDNLNKLFLSAIFFKNANVSNPGFDITPAKYVTGLITEFGVCKANSVEISKNINLDKI